jgi:hypothetical protein
MPTYFEYHLYRSIFKNVDRSLIHNHKKKKKKKSLQEVTIAAPSKTFLVLLLTIPA